MKNFIYLFVLIFSLNFGLSKEKSNPIIINGDLDKLTLDSLLSHWEEFSDSANLALLSKIDDDDLKSDSNSFLLYKFSSKVVNIFQSNSKENNKKYIIVKTYCTFTDSLLNNDVQNEKTYFEFYSLLVFNNIDSKWQLELINKALNQIYSNLNSESNRLDKIEFHQLNEKDVCLIFVDSLRAIASMNDAQSATFFVKLRDQYKPVFKYSSFYDEIYSFEQIEEDKQLYNSFKKLIKSQKPIIKKLANEIESLKNVNNVDKQNKIDSLQSNLNKRTTIIIGCDIDFEIKKIDGLFTINFIHKWFKCFEIDLPKRNYFSKSKKIYKAKISQDNSNDEGYQILQAIDPKDNEFSDQDYIETYMHKLMYKK